MHWQRLLIAGSAIGLAAGSCSPSRPVNNRNVTPVIRPATTQNQSGKPVIDFAHGAAGFPLVNRVPLNTSRHLTQELNAGYAARVRMPTTQAVVTIDGELPNIRSLRIDLSGGDVRSGYRPSSLKGLDRQTAVGHVDTLVYNACPLSFDGASQYLLITARDVTLSLLHARGEKEVLVMSDVASGVASFDAGLADLNHLMQTAAEEKAGRAGFFVSDTSLSMSSDSPHSLLATMKIRGFFLVIPTSLTISGRVDIDNGGEATFSHLTCSGSDIGGSIAANFINDRLKKYEGLRQPLTAFPGKRMTLQDVQIHVDQGLHVRIRFGHDPI